MNEKRLCEIAKEVLRITRPAIDELLKKAKRQHCHIVIMNPQIKPWDSYSAFKSTILYEESIKDGQEWKYPYAEIARSKAEQAWRNGQSNIITRMLAPATLKKGDTIYWGSFEYYGVIVACSGVEPWFDMLISGWIALAFQQLAQHEIQKFECSNPESCFLK